MIKDNSFKVAEEFEKSMGLPMGDRITVECKFTLDELKVIKHTLSHYLTRHKGEIDDVYLNAVESLSEYFEL